jgi:hypothetical protein
MKSKLYFCDHFDDVFALPKSEILKLMDLEGLESVDAYESTRETGTDYFYCKHFREVGMRSPKHVDCGLSCEAYKPRNVKNGCCKYRGYCYEKGEKVIIKNKINGLSKTI